MRICSNGSRVCGETALIEALAALGHQVLPEAAFEVIGELVAARGIEEQARWRAANQVQFQRMITQRQYGREVAARTSDAPLVFCDRGALDGKAYCQLTGVPWPSDLDQLTAPARYAHVLLLETLPHFDPRTPTGRVDDCDDSIRVSGLLELIYRPRTESLARLPVGPLQDRLQRALQVVGGSTTGP